MTVSPTAAVELRAIVKRYGSVVAVDRVSLTVAQGEFLSLLGPSGCGKTTTLRIIAGFVEPEAGEMLVMGEEISFLPPHKRDMGMVYQSYALFPHMTTFDNVAYGLRMRGRPAAQIRQRVGDALDLVRLQGLEGRYPSQLSGGQQQRVALARAIAIEPKVLLLDEPLSNLDAKLREQMQVELRDLQRRLGITTIYVTHDQEEALTLSDRIAVMYGGRIMQLGEPSDIYHRPANLFVANFIGHTNVFSGSIRRVNPSSGLAEFVSAQGTRLEIAVNGLAAAPLVDVSIAIRPEQVQLRAGAADPGANFVRGVISHAVYMGSRTTYHVELASGERLTIVVQNSTDALAWQVGAQVVCYLPREAFHVIAGRGEPAVAEGGAARGVEPVAPAG